MFVALNEQWGDDQRQQLAKDLLMMTVVFARGGRIAGCLLRAVNKVGVVLDRTDPDRQMEGAEARASPGVSLAMKVVHYAVPGVFDPCNGTTPEGGIRRRDG